MNCPHDSSELKLRSGSNSPDFYECPKCLCRFRFILIRWNNKCYAKHYKVEK